MKALVISIFLAAAVYTLHSEAAANQSSRVKVTGSYSDMRSVPESGDILGIEVFVLPSRSGYQVVFQDAEGSPNVPTVVPAKIEKNHIEFDLPERQGYSGKFVGVITNNDMRGEFTNGQLSSSGKKTFILKRGRSYWQ